MFHRLRKKTCQLCSKKPYYNEYSKLLLSVECILVDETRVSADKLRARVKKSAKLSIEKMLLCLPGEIDIKKKKKVYDKSDKKWKDENFIEIYKVPKPFMLSNVEVTQKLYRSVMGSNPAVWDDSSWYLQKKDIVFISDDNLPMYNMTYYEAMIFCNRLSEIEGLEPCYSMTFDFLILMYLGPKPRKKSELTIYESFVQKSRSYVESNLWVAFKSLKEVLDMPEPSNVSIKFAEEATPEDIARAHLAIIHPYGAEDFEREKQSGNLSPDLKVLKIEYLTEKETSSLDPTRPKLYERPYFFGKDTEGILYSSLRLLKDSYVFCDFTKNGYRIPTDTEWVYAAQVGLKKPKSSSRSFSGTFDTDKALDYAWVKENSGGVPHPVATKQPNAWGFYDMTGNVYEYCWDNTSDHSNFDHLARGGDYKTSLILAETSATNVSSFRWNHFSLFLYASYGLRVARSI